MCRINQRWNLTIDPANHIALRKLGEAPLDLLSVFEKRNISILISKMMRSRSA